MNIYFLVY